MEALIIGLGIVLSGLVYMMYEIIQFDIKEV